MAIQNGTPGVDPDFDEFFKLPGDTIEAKIESAVKKSK
jgi:hypothetical protein